MSKVQVFDTPQVVNWFIAEYEEGMKCYARAIFCMQLYLIQIKIKFSKFVQCFKNENSTSFNKLFSFGSSLDEIRLRVSLSDARI